MDILFLLIPLSIVLVFAIVVVLAWSVNAGQFEEMDTMARIALDECTDHQDA